MKPRSQRMQVINGIMALLGTVGIIVPVAVWSRPPGGYRVPLPTPFTDTIDVPPPKRQLNVMVRGFVEMEQTRQIVLTPTQARTTLRVLARWRNARYLLDRDAMALMEQLTSHLPAAQRTTLGTYMKSSGGGFGGGGFGGMTRRQEAAFEAFRANYNLFTDPATHPNFKELPEEFRQRYTMRWQQRRDWLKTLEKRAATLQKKS